MTDPAVVLSFTLFCETVCANGSLESCSCALVYEVKYTSIYPIKLAILRYILSSQETETFFMSETAVLLCDKVYKEAEMTTSVRPEVDRRPVGHTFSPLLLEQKMEQRKASLIMGRSSSHFDDVVVL